MKVLWMIPKWTLPAIDGARVATDTLIRNSVNAGMSVDVLCLPVAHEVNGAELMKTSWPVREIHTIYRNVPEKRNLMLRHYLKSFLRRPLMPLTFSSFSNESILKQTKKIVEKGQYDYIILEGLHLGIPLFLQNLSLKGKVIYRAHNIESDLWFNAISTQKNIFFKLILRLQAHLVKKIETRIVSKCEGVAAISLEDLNVLKQNGASSVELIPLGLNFKNPISLIKQQEKLKFLFIGRLDWPPNRDGLRWLLEEVWPNVMKLRSDVVLKIVGSGNSSWLKPYLNQSGVEFAGFVPSIDEAYQDCSFTLVPVFYGSGTRIKVLESFTKGRKLISTQMGIQGADLSEEDYIKAETAQDWIKVLSTVEMNSKIEDEVKHSILKLASKFGEEELGIKFYSWVKTL